MLQEKYLPTFDYSEVHSIYIHQSPQKVFSLVDDLDISESRVIRFLFRMRGLTPEMQTKRGLISKKFVELERLVDSELILGLVGQFWKANGNLLNLTPAEFMGFDQDEFLKATWNFQVISQNNSTTLLKTETRIKCLGKKAYVRFSLYWFFIRPFSGLIRKEILRLIKKKSEMISR